MPRLAFSPDPGHPAGFSAATAAGSAVYVSGQVALDEQGHLVGEGDCAAQAEQVFKNIERALKAAGATMDDLTKITCFLVDVGLQSERRANSCRDPVYSTGFGFRINMFGFLLAEIDRVTPHGRPIKGTHWQFSFQPGF